jgi:hypothetical protein
MSNFYVVGDEKLTKFLAADGSWVEDYNDAEQLSIEEAVMRQVDQINAGVITEIFEVPLLAEGVYQSIGSRLDELQELLSDVGVELSTVIGSEDETTWKMSFGNGLSLTIKLSGPDDFEFSAGDET